MTKDHVVPVSIMSNMKRKGGEHGFGEVVDACATCNAILGNKNLLTKARRSMYLVEQYANRLLWYEDAQEQDETLERIKACVLAYEGFLLEERQDLAAGDQDDEEQEEDSQPISVHNWDEERPGDRRRLAEAPLSRLLGRSSVHIEEYVLGCDDLLLLLRSGHRLPTLHADDRPRYFGFMASLPSLLNDIASLRVKEAIEQRWKREYNIQSLHAALMALTLWTGKDLRQRAAVLVGMLHIEGLTTEPVAPAGATGSRAKQKKHAPKPTRELTPADKAWWEITKEDRRRVGLRRFDGLWMRRRTTWKAVSKLDADDLLLLTKHSDTLPEIADLTVNAAFFADLQKRLREIKDLKTPGALKAYWADRFGIQDVYQGIAAIVFDQGIRRETKGLIAYAFRQNAGSAAIHPGASAKPVVSSVEKATAPSDLGPGDEAWWKLSSRDRAKLKTRKFKAILNGAGGVEVLWKDVSTFGVDDLLLLVRCDQHLPPLRLRYLDPSFRQDIGQRSAEVREAESLDALTWLWRVRFGIADPIQGMAAIVFDPEVERGDKAAAVWGYEKLKGRAAKASGRRQRG